MTRIWLWLLAAGALATRAQAQTPDVPAPWTESIAAAARGGRGWLQWGRDARHHGMAPVAGQRLDRVLADLVYDPFAEQERAEQFGVLAGHYQAPLADGDDVFMEWKTGTYISCDPPGWMTSEPCGVNTWSTQIWNVRRLHWQGGHLVKKWNFASDWKPAQVPALNFLGPSEPVFHPLLTPANLFVPGVGGTLFKLERGSGRVVTRINPFDTLDPLTYTAGSPVADPQGNLYYQAFRLARSNPWTTDVRGAWLIKVRPDGSTSKVSFSALAVGAPASATLPGERQRPLLHHSACPGPHSGVEVRQHQHGELPA